MSNICFFTENYFKGGLDTFIINLINSWPDEADRLTLICNRTHPGLEIIEKNITRPLKVIRYHNLFTTNAAEGRSITWWGCTLIVRAFYSIFRRFLQYPILFPWYVIRLSVYFYKSNFDRLMIIHGGYPGSILGRSALVAWRLSRKLPLAVFNFHNSAIKAHWSCIFFENIIDSLIINSSSHIVSVSSDCLQSLGIRKNFLGCKKLSYIYNGIADPHSLINVSRDLFPKEERYCLMLGTYETRKGHYYLLQAFIEIKREFPDVVLKIYGDGLSHEKYEVYKLVKDLNLVDDVFLGDYTTDKIRLLSRASVLVVPSQAHESFGLTIVEAMALSIPVVCTNVGGMPEVLKGANAGYVCAKDNPLEFAESIKKILRNPILASKLGKNGRIAYENKFLASTMAGHYKRLLE